MDSTFKQNVKELHKLAVARLDIVEAQLACQYVVEKVRDLGDTQYYPHFVTLVICYARPFTKNKPYGALKKKWAQFPDETTSAMHKQLLDARHKFIAHSDGSIRSMQITPKGYIIPGTQRRIEDYTCQVHKFYIPLDNFRIAKKNCQHLVSRMNVEIEKLLQIVGPELDFSKGAVDVSQLK